MNGCCPASCHELMRQSAVAFLATVKLTYRSWAVDEAGRDVEYQYGNCTRLGCRSTIGIPVRLLAQSNPYERLARAVKVAKILAYVPTGATRKEMDTLADALSVASEEQRASFARSAGCRTVPSTVTWADVVAAARGRVSATEFLAQVSRADEAIR